MIYTIQSVKFCVLVNDVVIITCSEIVHVWKSLNTAASSQTRFYLSRTFFLNWNGTTFSLIGCSEWVGDLVVIILWCNSGMYCYMYWNCLYPHSNKTKKRWNWWSGKSKYITINIHYHPNVKIIIKKLCAINHTMEDVEFLHMIKYAAWGGLVRFLDPHSLFGSRERTTVHEERRWPTIIGA